jgi:hypothetical protein
MRHFHSHRNTPYSITFFGLGVMGILLEIYYLSYNMMDLRLSHKYGNDSSRGFGLRFVDLNVSFLSMLAFETSALVFSEADASGDELEG